MMVWINGQFVEMAQAKVGYFDAGFQHAIGLFETMLARDGAVLRLEAHLERLATSAKELRIFEHLRIEPLAEAIQMCLEKNQMHCADVHGSVHARIRVTVTGGDLGKPFAGANASEDKPTSPQPTVCIHVQSATRYPDELFENGIGASVADNRANAHDPFASHKTLAYWPRIAALQSAARSGCSEALWFSTSNHLASGSVSSVMLMKDGCMLLPFARGETAPEEAPSPVLPGCTRAAMILWAQAMGVDVQRRMLTIDDVFDADEVLLTNSSWGVLPVIRVEQHVIADAKPGAMAQRLRERWLA
jgi:branched-subunit amino acid aminotransferase/4-amino-4-deoxychorismate lyase